MPRPRNCGLGISLIWPQVQRESTPFSQRHLPACCSCRIAAGDTSCCRTNPPFSHGRRVSRHCRNPCVHRAECSYDLCVPSKPQAMILRLGCRQFHGYSSISFPITSFPSMYCVGQSVQHRYAPSCGLCGVDLAWSQEARRRNHFSHVSLRLAGAKEVLAETSMLFPRNFGPLCLSQNGMINHLFEPVSFCTCAPTVAVSRQP